jgi:anti-sigma regulatory factor (Ser/Thr protein kinase)
MLLDIDLRLRPNVEAPAEARRSLEALRPSLDDLLVDDAVLLVSEIVSNSVRHASLDASDTIEVRIRGSRSMLHVDVVDPGPGFDPVHLRPSRENGGWGLWMLDRLATRWGVERNHVTKVWFELGSAVSAPGRRGPEKATTTEEVLPWERRRTRPKAT